MPHNQVNTSRDFLAAIIKRTNKEKERNNTRQLKQAMTPKEFDRTFRQLKAPTGIDTEHRQDLECRGFSADEIERYGFFSVAPRQQVVVPVRWTFPGICHETFSVAGFGYTVPFFNREGLVHGYQVRLDKAETGKYRWVKGVLSSHIPVNGKLELPLTYVAINDTKGKTVGLVEGGLKALLAAKRVNHPIIGAAGGQFSASIGQFKQMAAGAETAIVYPDGGDVLNLNVMQRWRKQVRELTRIGLRSRAETSFSFMHID